ncbi:MAG TPA: hypothetical protein DDZ83_00245 [Nitrospinae bacterium]|nr:hypothetical protein [Nitrospinota bacterium]
MAFAPPTAAARTPPTGATSSDSAARWRRCALDPEPAGTTAHRLPPGPGGAKAARIPFERSFPMFEGIHHISIAVDDLEEARDFYAGLLELAEIDRPPLPNPGYWFQVGVCQLHLTGKSKAENGHRIPGTGAGETHFALMGGDLEAVKRRIESAGISVKDGINAAIGMRQLFFRDPSNNLVEVFAPLDS